MKLCEKKEKCLLSVCPKLSENKGRSKNHKARKITYLNAEFKNAGSFFKSKYFTSVKLSHKQICLIKTQRVQGH